MRKSIWVAVSLALMASTGFAQNHPQTDLTNGLLHLKVYLPNATTGYYRGTRFDWSGVIANLENAGHNYYPEWFQRSDPKVHDFIYDGADIVPGACSAITGVPEEFVTGDDALGFNEAKAGGTFIKIGVGVLRRPDDSPYDKFRLYDIVNGGTWTVKQTSDSIVFTQTLSDPSTGYGYIYRKTLSLTKGKPQMVLEHSLRNTGTKAIQSSVYDHNFLYLDRQAPGPGTVITVPFQIQASQLPDKNLAEVRGNQIAYMKSLGGEDRVYFGIQGFGAAPKDYDILVANSKLGAGVHITGDRPLSRLMLWSIRAPLSMEPYIDMNIAPGAEFTWKITYDYYASGTSAK